MFRKTIVDYEELAQVGIIWTGTKLPKDVNVQTGWECSECGHRWRAKYSHVKHKTGCPQCAGTLPNTTMDYTVVGIENGYRWLGAKLPKNARVITDWECIKCGTCKQTSFRVIKMNLMRCEGCA